MDEIILKINDDEFDDVIEDIYYIIINNPNLQTALYEVKDLLLSFGDNL
jgi:hypothetical protein